MYQKKYIGVKFSKSLVILDRHYEYSKMYDWGSLNGPTNKFVNLQRAHAGKIQKMYKLYRIDILDDATRAAMASANTQTDQYSVEEHIIFDHKLAAIRLDSSNDKEAINSCPT